MITIEQCRAARGLLGWTQNNLGTAAGISKTAVNNFERGLSDPKLETLKAIELAFLGANIDFLDQLGVRMRRDHAQIIKGDRCYALLWDDIGGAVNDGAEILIYTRDDDVKFNAALTRQRARLPTACITERNLAKHKGILFLPIVIYGDKIAITLQLGQMIALIQSKDAAQAVRFYLEAIWNKDRMPDITP